MKRAAEIFNNKVSLIYEFDKKSPLFVRKASIETEAGNAEKAVEILTAGLKLYPNYASAYIILGNAYADSGNFPEALKAYKNGCELIHSPRTYDHYLKQIDLLQKQKSLFQNTSQRSFVSENEPEQHSEPEQEVKPEIKKDRPFEDLERRLEEIAKGLSSVKLNDTDPSGDRDFISEAYSDDNMIVSETLAKIYAAQGEITEAIQVYKKLIKKNPSKEDYYNEKINELRIQLE